MQEARTREESSAEEGLREPRPDSLPSHYVAVGASAGGLEAIEAFFERLPADSGAAFVVVQHLSPDYKSLMVEILSKKTPMPVHRAEEGMPVLPDRVYLIPPRMNLSIFQGELHLSEQDHGRGINLPIDLFLKSLAEDQGEKAVAVILSGTGSDGARGVRAVKEGGGLVMVQDEESARFDGMPRAAASTGLADFILRPEDMPRKLLAYMRMPYARGQRRPEPALSDEEGFGRIFGILRDRCKVDFSYYKPSTVGRRIERRMAVCQLDRLQDYVARLEASPPEAAALFRELLIGVTSFFRDPEVFRLLEEVHLPQLLREAQGRELRFWTAGCSTGEEAYSLAILVRETAERFGLPAAVKIFATDIDEEALRVAAAGSYPESAAADLSPAHLAKYFVRKEQQIQVQRGLREMVVFARHNLVKDPPFTKISLLSCRNLLIYLQPILQRRVLDAFGFSLLPGGLLLLGTSEAAGEAAEAFEVLDNKKKLYRSKGAPARTEAVPAPPPAEAGPRGLRVRSGLGFPPLRPAEEERLLERLLESLSPDFLLFSALVNERLELLHMSGDPGGILRLPSGRPSTDIAKLAVKELSLPLVAGIQRCFREQSEVGLSGLRLQRGAEPTMVDLVIRYLPPRRGQEGLAVVLVQPPAGGERAAAPRLDLAVEAEQRLRELEQELQISRENLQATIEELETSNEELQSANEELLASNEELQSTNEELQSTNEELFTVNAEHHKKILELTEATNDVENLLAASQIGTLVLDENCAIRHFSPATRDLFRLLDSDLGRPVSHIRNDLPDLDFLALIRQVQETRSSLAREIRSAEGRWFFLRIIPYAVGPGVFSGTVSTFTDISTLKSAERSLDLVQSRFDRIAEASTSLIRFLPPEGEGWFNRAWLDHTGAPPEATRAERWLEFVHPEDRGRVAEAFHEAARSRGPRALRYRLKRAEGGFSSVLEQLQPLLSGPEGFEGLLCSALPQDEAGEVEP